MPISPDQTGETPPDEAEEFTPAEHAGRPTNERDKAFRLLLLENSDWIDPIQTIDLVEEGLVSLGASHVLEVNDKGDDLVARVARALAPTKGAYERSKRVDEPITVPARAAQNQNPLVDLLDLIDSHDDEYPTGAAAALRRVIEQPGAEQDSLIDVALRLVATDRVAGWLDESGFPAESVSDAAADLWRKRNPDSEQTDAFTLPAIAASL